MEDGGNLCRRKRKSWLDRARYRGRAKMQIQAYMIGLVQNIKRMMGCGPVVEVGLCQTALGAGSNWLTLVIEKLNLFFQFFDQPNLA